MSVWLGGLAALALIVLDRDPDARRDRRPLLAGRAHERDGHRRDRRVRGVAAGRMVGRRVPAHDLRPPPAREDRVFVVLLALAAWSRSIVRARRPATLSAAVATETPASTTARPLPTDPDVRNLRWSVGGELVFGIAVLVITSMLVNAQPARGALSLPYSTEFREPTMLIDLIISPAKAGPVDIHIYTLSPSGGNLFTPGRHRRDEPAVEGHRADHGSARAGRTEPLPRVHRDPSSQIGTTATCTDKFSIPFAGKWLIVIRALRNEFDEVAVQTTVDIR